MKKAPVTGPIRDLSLCGLDLIAGLVRRNRSCAAPASSFGCSVAYSAADRDNANTVQCIVRGAGLYDHLSCGAERKEATQAPFKLCIHCCGRELKK
jgi:hypothetical protein